MRIRHKRGASFAIIRNSANDGMPTDMEGWTLRSQLRSGSTLLADLTVTVEEGEDAEPGAFMLSADDTTDAWPLGRAAFDVEYTDSDGIKFKGETIAVDIIASPTYPAEEAE